MAWVSFVSCLAGTAAGVLLFAAGWLAGRRHAGSRGQAEGGTGTAAKENLPAQAVSAVQWRELANFLNYDGSEMPKAEEEEQSGGR